MIYQPAEDSFLLEKEIKKYARGKRFLDMGAGCGIQSLAAIKAGAKYAIAADIDKECVDYLKKIGVNAVRSDLFSNINGNFDLIAFNPPYLPEDKREDKESSLITSGGKKGDEIIIRFLKEVKNHLADKGLILLLVSSLTPRKKIENLLKKNGFKKTKVASQKLFMEELEVWKIERGWKVYK